MRYKFIGQEVLAQIEALPEDVRELVLADLEELVVDPENKRDDWRSTIQAYRDPTYGHTYSVLLVESRFVLVYTVYQDYPKVWLRRLTDYDSLFD